MRDSTRRSVLAGGLIALAGCLGDESPDGDDTEPRIGPTAGETQLSSAFPVALFDDEDEEVANVHYHEDGGSHWHFQPLTVPLNETQVFKIRVRDPVQEDLPISDAIHVDVQTDPDVPFAASVEDAALTLEGIREGEGELALIIQDGEGDWETPTLTVEVESR